MSTLLLTGCVLFLLQSALWAVSVRLRNVSIVDIAWGPCFAIIAWIAAAKQWPDLKSLGGWHWLPPALTTVWGLRLGAHLARRNLGREEDRRYAAFRTRAGEKFWWTSLASVFWLQAALIWVISLPLQVMPTTSFQEEIILLFAGSCPWLVGFLFETIGDWQLSEFQSHPENRGKVLDRGLWQYTRHPNYFGDCCVWWGIFLCSMGLGRPWWTIVGPLLMTFLLVRVSGVRMLEADLVQSKPGYAEYVGRTSSFIPWPPRDRSDMNDKTRDPGR